MSKKGKAGKTEKSAETNNKSLAAQVASLWDRIPEKADREEAQEMLTKALEDMVYRTMICWVFKNLPKQGSSTLSNRELQVIAQMQKALGLDEEDIAKAKEKVLAAKRARKAKAATKAD